MLVGAAVCSKPLRHPPAHQLDKPPRTASSGLESSFFAKNETLSNHMGLFLQKVNIIRDYLVGWGWAWVVGVGGPHYEDPPHAMGR